MGPRAFWFIVNERTWREHEKAGIAAINDPHFQPQRQSLAQRQSAIAEVAGIRPGDLMFFYVMGTMKILGIYEATTRSYFDTQPLFSEAVHIKAAHPFRVGFREIANYPNPIDISDIWSARDQGLIWTVQQSRGDAVGVHACIGLMRPDVRLMKRIFAERNILELAPTPAPPLPRSLSPLPIELTTFGGRLRYENALKALLLEDLAEGHHKEVLGNYDDVLVNVPTSARMEMDVLMLRYSNQDIIWFQVVELKASEFTQHELTRLIDYEEWLIRVPAKGNRRAVYPIALALDFSEEVRLFVKRREDYGVKSIRLVAYSLSKSSTRHLDLREVAP
ncbi:hypothetical protein ES707_04504 [subsurface metagenome]